MDVVKHGSGEQAKGTFRLLLDEIVYALDHITYLLKSGHKRDVICGYTKQKLEFPVLLSRFTTQNTKATKLLIKELGNR